MNRFTKITLVVAIELVLMAFFLNFSEWSRLTSTIIFPPVFAVTVYVFVIFTLDIKKENLTKTDVLFALLLASVSLVSAGMGFHYAANDINDIFLPLINGQDVSSGVTNRLDYLDEIFSHAIAFVGFVGIMISVAAWYYFNRFRPLIERKIERNLSAQTKILDSMLENFVIVFIGAMLALMSIEANMLIYGVAFFSLTVPLVLLKSRKYTPTLQGIDLLKAYWNFIATYLGVALAYYLGTITKLFTHLGL